MVSPTVFLVYANWVLIPCYKSKLTSYLHQVCDNLLGVATDGRERGEGGIWGGAGALGRDGVRMRCRGEWVGVGVRR